MHLPSFYHSSKTSTVIPHDRIESVLNWDQQTDFYIGDLSGIPGRLALTSSGNLVIRGAVSWEEAKKFLKPQGRVLKTSPTEQLALITAGVATSCTGERSFGFGPLRLHIIRLKYLDFEGEERELLHDEPFPVHSSYLSSYQSDFQRYRLFKNAPYPRCEKAVDLMIGTEGQLGVITEVEIETAAEEEVAYVFVLLPHWKETYEPHLEIFWAIQSHRASILSCELLDAQCMNFLKPDERIGRHQDVIFFEIKSSAFLDIYRQVFEGLTLTAPDHVFKIAENKFHAVRTSIPLAIYEENAKKGVIKAGTDVQVTADKFGEILNVYRKFAAMGVRYCLFGHFGEAHLHFNFMPSPGQAAQCSEVFERFYEKVYEWAGSPFAEHGIGLIKQKYIGRFYGPNQLGLFQDIKKQHDPYQQFFPQGFMSQR